MKKGKTSYANRIQDTPIPEKFEPSDYHTNALASAQKKLKELETMTPQML